MQNSIFYQNQGHYTQTKVKHPSIASIYQVSYVDFLKEIKSYYDQKTSWVDNHLRMIQLLPDSSTMQEILRIIKKSYHRLPPPTDYPDSPNNTYVNISRMENYVPINSDIHKSALKQVLSHDIPQYNTLRWSDCWSENADGFFKFEIIVMRPNLITCNLLLILQT